MARSVRAEREHLLQLTARYRATPWTEKGTRRHLKRAIERSARRLLAHEQAERAHDR